MHLTDQLQKRRPGRNDNHLEASFIVLRRGMAVIALLFPLAFIASSWAGRTAWQPSMSAYYWTEDLERNFYVGGLCAIGVFLILYKGYTIAEDWILNVAGACAVGTAFFAMTRDSDCSPGGSSLHSVFAVAFFACIAFVCIVMSRNSLAHEPDSKRKKTFLLWYWIFAIAMGIGVFAALAVKLLPLEKTQSLCENGWTFWCESFAIWSFAAFWFLKTKELEPVRRRIKAQVAQGARDPQAAAG